MSAAKTASLHAIVLAAGASSRFGSPKQLARFERQPLLLRVMARATEVAGLAVTVVLGAHAAEIAATLNRSSATLLINRDWPEGLASSIRTAVRHLPGSCDGALLLLADQPLVSATTLARLAAIWRRQPRSVARRDRDVDRGQLVLVQAKGFSCQALDQVPRDRVAAALRCDREP